MKSLFRVFLLAIVFPIALSAQQRPAPALTYELACPAGYSPLPNEGKSFDALTGYWRANLCMKTDGSGRVVCQMDGCGSAPGAPAGSLQGNNGGVFAGIPGTAADFANGMVTIAPPSGFGSPAALSIQSNPAGEDILDLYLTGQQALGHSSLRIYGTGDDALQVALQEQDTFSDVMLLDPANFSLFSNTPLETFNCSLTNTGSSPLCSFVNLPVTIDESAVANPLVALSLTADAHNSDIQDWKDHTGATVAHVDKSGNLTVPSCTGCGSVTAMNAPQRVTLSADYTMVTSNTQYVIGSLTETVTMPAAPGNYRVLVSYSLWMITGGNVCAAEVVDTTNTRGWAFSEHNDNGLGYSALTGTEVSSQTYAAGATATFTLQASCSGASITAKENNAGANTLTPALPSFLSITPILSN